MDQNIVIIGFGNQARAWSQNLRDSGYGVSIYLRPNSKSRGLVDKFNFPIIQKNELRSFNKIALLTPDNSHGEILTELQADLQDETIIIYAHGFSLTYKDINSKFKQFQHTLLAPKAIASELRFQFECDGGLGGIYSFEFTTSEQTKKEVLDIGSSLGLNYMHESTCEQETIADLFSEQSILCSTLPYAAMKSFNKLTENGIDPEVAYLECWYELKLIVDTMVKMGPHDFFKLISPNALLGSEVGKSILFDHDFDKKLNDMFENIKSGSFVDSIEQVNFEEVKADVLNFWKDQKLNNLHENLKDQLFKE